MDVRVLVCGEGLGNRIWFGCAAGESLAAHVLLGVYHFYNLLGDLGAILVQNFSLFHEKQQASFHVSIYFAEVPDLDGDLSLWFRFIALQLCIRCLRITCDHCFFIFNAFIVVLSEEGPVVGKSMSQITLLQIALPRVFEFPQADYVDRLLLAAFLDNCKIFFWIHVEHIVEDPVLP